MRVALLTTDTRHHTYFVWRLAELVPLVGVFLESRVATPPFDTSHPFERIREEYEREVLLGGSNSSITEPSPSWLSDSINEATIRDELMRLEPDLCFVFGTGRLEPQFLDSIPGIVLNLHGGNPEEYRGLDTHLWAIYHRDFANLVTTLHLVDAELDTGAIVGQAELQPEKRTELHELRAMNTRACLELSVAACRSFDEFGHVPQRRQTRRGRYYSFMPTVIKNQCVQRFAEHTAEM